MRIYFGEPRVEVDIPDDVITTLSGYARVCVEAGKQGKTQFQVGEGKYDSLIVAIGVAIVTAEERGRKAGRRELSATVQARWTDLLGLEGSGS